MRPYTQRVEDGQSQCDLSSVRLLHAAGSERGGSAGHTCRLSRLPAGGVSSWLPRAACRGGWTGAGLAAYLVPGGGLSACLSSGPGGSPAALQAVRKANRRPCRGLGRIEGLKAAVL